VDYDLTYDALEALIMTQTFLPCLATGICALLLLLLLPLFLLQKKSRSQTPFELLQPAGHVISTLSSCSAQSLSKLTISSNVFPRRIFVFKLRLIASRFCSALLIPARCLSAKRSC
jgi:hypothetical protein